MALTIWDMGFDIRSIFVLKFILFTHSCLNIWTAVYVKFTMRYNKQIVCFWPYFLTMTQHWWPTFKHAKRVTSVVQSTRASYADEWWCTLGLISLHSASLCVELCLSPSSRHPRLISSGPCLYLPNITVVFSLFWFICLFCGANSTICCLTRSWVPEAFTERDKKWHENHKAEIGGRPRCLCCLASQS